MATTTHSHNTSPDIFIRLKPLSAEPGNGKTGQPAERIISKWANDSICTSGGPLKSDLAWTYPNLIFGPDVDQTNVFETVGSALVDSFIGGMDVNFVAVGQTGSGKTHTIFGPPGSLQRGAQLAQRLEETRDEDESEGEQPGPLSNKLIDLSEFGLFVRVGLSILLRVEELNRQPGVSAYFYASMVEIVFTAALDLLADKSEIEIDLDNGALIGARTVHLASPQDVLRLGAAAADRTTRATLMNDTSSRTHCATCLGLLLRRTATRSSTDVDDVGTRGEDVVRRSRFVLVDMMGSERTKGQNSAHDVRINSKKTVAGVEGIMANFALVNLLFVCEARAKERSARRKRRGGRGRRGRGQTRGRRRRRMLGASESAIAYKKTSLMRILDSSMRGHARTVIFLTLSLAPRNGNESYYTLKCGSKFAMLPTAPRPNRFVSVAAMMRKANREIQENQRGLRGMSIGKYVAIRKRRIVYWKQVLWLLERARMDEGERVKSGFS